MFRPVSTLRAPIRSLLPTLTSLIQSSSCLKPDHPSFKLPIDPSSSVYSNPSLPLSFIFSLPFSRSSRQKNEDENNDASFDNKDPKSPHNLFVVQPRLRPDALLQVNLSEALNLANSLEEQREWDFGCEFGERELPPHVVVQNPAVRSSRAHADTFFGPGTVETVKCHLNAVESEGRLDAIFVNTILSGIQQRNLERAWGKPVLDRVGLIIEIFNAHAETKEAKLQSELAALMYKRTRLIRIRGPDGRLTFGAAGEAEVVSARGRGSGGRGFISGAGETELQLQRRRILERRNHLLSQIEEVRRTRALQRAARKRHGGSQGQGLATVAVVGYTNAGKSTLVGALSESDLYSDSRLFATVDPKLRSVILPSGRKVLLSDTVGFISDLPVQLVEAFHATLEEVVEADLLVHVLDSSAFNLEEQRATVLHVLRQIGVSEEKLQNMIEVWNKIDLRDKDDGGGECLDEGEENDDAGSFSEAEEGDVISELSQGEIIYKDMITDLSSGEVSDGDDRVKVSSVDSDGNVHGQLGMSSDGWMIEDEQQDESSKCWKMIDDGTHSQPQDCQGVETSAVMGVGLQKLLELIDKKLSTQKVLETSSFDRKWRPPRSEDARTEVDQ